MEGWFVVGVMVMTAAGEPSHRALHGGGRHFTPQQLQAAIAQLEQETLRESVDAVLEERPQSADMLARLASGLPAVFPEGALPESLLADPQLLGRLLRRPDVVERIGKEPGLLDQLALDPELARQLAGGDAALARLLGDSETLGRLRDDPDFRRLAQDFSKDPAVGHLLRSPAFQELAAKLAQDAGARQALLADPRIQAALGEEVQEQLGRPASAASAAGTFPAGASRPAGSAAPSARRPLGAGLLDDPGHGATRGSRDPDTPLDPWALPSGQDSAATGPAVDPSAAGTRAGTADGPLAGSEQLLDWARWLSRNTGPLADSPTLRDAIDRLEADRRSEGPAPLLPRRLQSVLEDLGKRVAPSLPPAPAPAPPARRRAPTKVDWPIPTLRGLGIPDPVRMARQWRSSLPESSSFSMRPPDLDMEHLGLPLVVGLVVAAGMLIVFVVTDKELAARWLRKDSAPADAPEPADPSSRQLVCWLFERTALRLLGESARPQHHRRIAGRLAGPDGPAAQAAQNLADLYEAARYSPPSEPFGPDRVREAERLAAALVDSHASWSGRATQATA